MQYNLWLSYTFFYFLLGEEKYHWKEGNKRREQPQQKGNWRYKSLISAPSKLKIKKEKKINSSHDSPINK